MSFTHATDERPTRYLRLSSAVLSVDDLEASEAFYRTLLKMTTTVRTTSAALLANEGGYQLYLRELGPRAAHGLRGIGIPVVIWTATDGDDLSRCERFLREHSRHVDTVQGDGFALVEGRDPSGLPVVLTYPGPDQLARDQVIPRVYEW